MIGSLDGSGLKVVVLIVVVVEVEVVAVLIVLVVVAGGFLVAQDAEGGKAGPGSTTVEVSEVDPQGGRGTGIVEEGIKVEVTEGGCLRPRGPK